MDRFPHRNLSIFIKRKYKGINMRKNKLLTKLFLFAILAFSISLVYMPKSYVYANEPKVVVIDPGHGGENLGAKPDGYLEKDLNMTVAFAMYEELLKYDNVKVYMTHTDDVDLSLKERAEFAASKNADFMFSLHFNMSENHTHFGTEVWISAFDEHYAKGLSFAKIQIQAMEELGLYSRGIKTRLKSDEVIDYYGIIRESRELGVTCALIEHCHLDHKNDNGYYENDEKLKMLGRTDATSVAKYLGLTSNELQVDYSDYPKEDIPIPGYVMKPDTTAPDICYIEEASCDMTTGNVTFTLTAQDYDSPMLYYSYSLDNGDTWSEFFAWEEGQDTMEVTINIPSGTQSPTVVFRAHNLYDLVTVSNPIAYSSFLYEKVNANDNIKEDETNKESATTDETIAAGSDNVEITFRKEKKKTETEEEFPFLIFLEMCLVIVSIVFFAVLIAKIVKMSKRSRRRRQYKKRQ